MELNEIMTRDEQYSVAALIAAYLNEQVARLNLDEAVTDLEAAKRQLTEDYFREDGKDGRVGTVPARFVAYYRNEPYLIEVDEDGDSGHRVSRIAGVLEV